MATLSIYGAEVPNPAPQFVVQPVNHIPGRVLVAGIEISNPAPQFVVQPVNHIPGRVLVAGYEVTSVALATTFTWS